MRNEVANKVDVDQAVDDPLHAKEAQKEDGPRAGECGDSFDPYLYNSENEGDDVRYARAPKADSSIVPECDAQAAGLVNDERDEFHNAYQEV